MAGTGDKLLTAAEIKEVTDTKVDKDFSALTTLPNGLSDTDLINVRRSGTNYKLSGSDLAPTPLVVSITTGQWSGSGSDYYITVTASNVTANSILVPTYDHTSDSQLKGPVWCVPAAGSFTINTSAIPTGTVTIMVQFIGTLGEAQYQVLADVYSKSQTDALIAQSTALSSLPITRIENDYVNSASINRLAAYKRAGISMLYGNLALNAELPAVPTGGDSNNAVAICKIDGWTGTQDALVHVPSRDNGTKVLLARVDANGIVKIATSTAPCPASFYRFTLSAM